MILIGDDSHEESDHISKPSAQKTGKDADKSPIAGSSDQKHTMQATLQSFSKKLSNVSFAATAAALPQKKEELVENQYSSPRAKET